TSFKIETNTESPIMCNPYRQPISIINELKKEIEKMLEADIIQPGNAGTWASPAFLIQQKSGSRFIVDYRKLNALTKPFLHPIPRIDDILDKLNGEKCNWLQKSIKILGQKVEGNGIKMDEEKINAIVDRKPPSNLKELQSFLGLCNYNRKFVKDFAKIAAALYILCKPDVKFFWNSKCEEAFKQCFNFSLMCHLSQTDENGREYVCSYASPLLKESERHYSATELECLAAVWSINYFRNYLYGFRFTLITDHYALEWLLTSKDPNTRLLRWSIAVQSFQFDILHKDGSKHSNVDALNRSVFSLNIEEKKNDCDISEKYLEPHQDTNLIYFLKYGRHSPGLSRKQVNRVNLLQKHYKLEGDNLCYRKDFHDSKFNLKVPKPNERLEIIAKSHNIGHFKTETVFRELPSKFFWKNMQQDIQNFINKCENCLAFREIPIVDHPALALPIDSIFDRIGIDLIL
ncbi:unnamed protein product, partial [Brachionus calyciflorus]